MLAALAGFFAALGSNFKNLFTWGGKEKLLLFF